ncbi:polysaccharide lyase 8 family protein [Joostella sp. CR20]|uniref:polysaccharide lyase 8 family protein n=1 Tax=Joostella sp. CR20 TaxID=2804312 RepID=UPI00313C9B0B
MIKFMRAILFCTITFSSIYAQNDFEVIMNNIQQINREQLTDISKLDSTVKKYNSTYKSEGYWTDVDYETASKTYWYPLNHLVKTATLVDAYVNPGSTFYKDSELFSRISKALEYWNQRNLKSKSWWFNQIATPQKLGELLIILRQGEQQLDKDLEVSLREKMKRGNPFYRTGANKLDIALHFIYYGCLAEDERILKVGVSQSFEPLRLSEEDGIQYDYSYQQHGDQLYIGGYGEVLVNTEVKVAKYLQNTSYALSGEQLAIFRDFIINTYLRVHRGKYMDFTVNGRSISRKNNTNKEGFKNILADLIKIDPLYAEIYEDAILRFTDSSKVGNGVKQQLTHYWISDYTLYNSPKFDFSVRTASTRTSKSETGNGESLKSHFVADGATCIRVDGDEYYNIFPIWEWNKIPGVTAPETSQFPKRKHWEDKGTSTFTGAVTDSIYGVTTYVLNEYNTSAKKGWFFFKDEVVCLGAGITSTAEEPILTTINQSLLDGTVSISSEEKISNLGKNEKLDLNAVDWIFHDKIAYFFPEEEHVTISNKAQSGSWASITKTGDKSLISEEVFTSYISHGKKPNNQSYAYIVAPGLTTISEVKMFDEDDLQILQNTEKLQAVYKKSEGVYQIIFYEAGTFKDKSVKISVDAPCVMLVKGSSSETIKISVADPSQLKSTLNIQAKFPKLKGKIEKEIIFPQGNYKGSSTSIILK